MFSGALLFFIISGTVWVLTGQADLPACSLLFQGMLGVGAGGDKYILIHSPLDLNRDYHHLYYCRVEFGVAFDLSGPKPPCQPSMPVVGSCSFPVGYSSSQSYPAGGLANQRGLFTHLLIGFCTKGSSRELHLWPKSAWC